MFCPRQAPTNGPQGLGLAHISHKANLSSPAQGAAALWSLCLHCGPSHVGHGPRSSGRSMNSLSFSGLLVSRKEVMFDTKSITSTSKNVKLLFISALMTHGRWFGTRKSMSISTNLREGWGEGGKGQAAPKGATRHTALSFDGDHPHIQHELLQSHGRHFGMIWRSYRLHFTIRRVGGQRRWLLPEAPDHDLLTPPLLGCWPLSLVQPSKLFFRTEGEIKEFPTQSKADRVDHHHNGLTRNGKKGVLEVLEQNTWRGWKLLCQNCFWEKF